MSAPTTGSENSREVRQRVGLIGAGQMGTAIWQNLSGHNIICTVYDILPDARRRIQSLGALVTDHLAELAQHADIVLLSLPTSLEAEAVLFGDEGLFAVTSQVLCVIDTTSGDPMKTRLLASRTEKLGIAFLDVGVSGGVSGAQSGTLKVMVGGSHETVLEYQPLLEMLGNVFHCGASGSGHAMKCLLNMRNIAIGALTAEVIVLGARYGLEPDRIVQITGASQQIADLVKDPSKQSAVGFALALASKDCDIAMALGIAMGTSMSVCGAAQQMMRASAAHQGPGADYYQFVDSVIEWSQRPM